MCVCVKNKYFLWVRRTRLRIWAEREEGKKRVGAVHDCGSSNVHFHRHLLHLLIIIQVTSTTTSSSSFFFFIVYDYQFIQSVSVTHLYNRTSDKTEKNITSLNWKMTFKVLIYRSICVFFSSSLFLSLALYLLIYLYLSSFAFMIVATQLTFRLPRNVFLWLTRRFALYS